MTKKVTAILLALILGLSSMLTVFAEEVQNDAQTEAITESTADVTAKAGEDAVFSVKTIGEVRSFQWQVSKDGGKKWTDLNPKTYGATETLRIPVKENYDGYLYRCEVTFADYRVEHSAPAKLRLSKTVTFESEAVAGVKISVEAPEGALPEGTTMTVGAVNKTAVQNAVDKAADLEGTVLAAADITFYANGEVVEPSAPIKVTMTSEAIAKAVNPVVVHIPTSAEELEKATAVPEKVDAEKELNAVKFEADQFSVYAVVEPGSDAPEARATIKFYGKNTSAPVATVYVKNADLANDEMLSQIVYDPGVDGLEKNEIFKGWSIGAKNTTEGLNYTTSTTAKNIEGIRTFLKTQTFIEGDVYNVYAMIFIAYNVQFKDEDGVLIQGETLLSKSGEAVDYEIKVDYTPKTEDQQFQGWYATTTEDGAITPVKDIYPLNDQVSIKGDVIFAPTAPRGNWLVFEGNPGTDTQNKPSYTPPQFVRTGEAGVVPQAPTRVGYTFGGWYNEAACTSEYDFDTILTGRTTVYAKWTVVETASYIVIIWKQNVNGNDYDFEGTISLSGTPNTPISTVTQQGTGDNAYARVNGTNYQYTGFHLKEYDQNVTIKANGTSVVNVYYDRNEYTLTFQTNYAVSNNDNDNNPKKYGMINGYYQRVYWNNGAFRTSNYWWGTEYSGTVFTHSNNYSTIKTITVLYEQNVADQFPIVGTNGVTYDSGERWKPQSNSLGWSEVMVLVDIMPAENVTFRIDAFESRPLKTMYYYVEALPNAQNTVTHKGVQYVLYTEPVRARYNGVTSEDYIELNGFEKTDVTGSIGGGTLTPDSSGFYIYNETQDQSIYFFYSRMKYPITYQDGVYVNGDGVATGQEPRGTLKTMPESDYVYYQASLADKEAYFTPVYDGYVFVGWFLDDGCTQPLDWDSVMPKGGIKVFAKWVAVQYRVFLRANVDPSDTSLDWGGQSMSFRVDEDEKLANGNKIIGTRDDYELVGWFTDEAFTTPFNFDAYPVNSGLPFLKDYDKTEPTELDKYSQAGTDKTNHDATGNRIWITKKLELYAKWRALLKGARGIQIIYDAGEGHNSANSEAEYTDPLYYMDDSKAVAQPASIPTDNTLHFVHWVVQKWNGTSWVEDKKVSPGDSFEILKANAKRDNNPEWQTGDPQNQQYFYTIRVVAEYGPKQTETPTHINWYQNEEDVTSPIYEDENLQINEATPIHDLTADTRAAIKLVRGHMFLGWARMPEYDNLDENGNKTDASKVVSYYPNLTAADVYLKYVPASGEGEEAVEAHYELADGTAVGYVAADERMPYHALYAVWKKVFYVVHGSDNKVEVIDLDDAKERWTYTTGYDTKNDKYTSYYYGGYGLIADTEVVNLAGFTLTKGGTEASYSGDFTWSRANAQKNANAFTISTDTAVASASKRTVGDVFYIKEVPSSYLAAPKIATVKADYGAGALTSVSILSVVDTTIYRAGGINGTKGTFASSFSMTQNNGSGTSSTTAKQLFGLDGYLTVNAWSTEPTTEPLKLVPFWKTYDSVTVNSNSSRTITISGNEVTNAKEAGLE